MKLINKFLLLAGLLSSALRSDANVIELNFDNVGIQTPLFSNFDYSGFRFSPSCHVDNNPSNPAIYPETSGLYLGSDFSGCLDAPIGLGNADYLGPRPIIGGVNIYIESISKRSWSLNALTLHGEIINVHSSKGGIRNINYLRDAPIQTFSGPEWSNIEWLLITGGGGTPQGFDNLVVTIPEPSSLILFSIGLVFLGSKVRRQS